MDINLSFSYRSYNFRKTSQAAIGGLHTWSQLEYICGVTFHIKKMELSSSRSELLLNDCPQKNA